MEGLRGRPHVMVVFGTRPEFIKMIPVLNSLKSNQVKHTICNTSQHRQMLKSMLDIFEVSPDYNLHIMKNNQTLVESSIQILKKFDRLLSNVRPDIILVQGDTTTTFISSLVSFYQMIKVGHIEAGLRTYDKHNPFPEEANRQLTSVIADYHFAPTKMAFENLLAQNISEKKIFITGNTGIDSLFMVLELIKNKGIKLNKKIKRFVDNRRDSQIILVTAHRRENIGIPLKSICLALRELANDYPNSFFIYPVHLNPNVLKPVHELLDGIPNISLIDPPDYFTFVFLMQNSYLILTDSGGIQEEAPSLGKPVLVLREKTERPEGIRAGVAKIIGTNKSRIISETSKLLDKKDEYKKMTAQDNPYGDGRAADRIVDIILSNM